jgi:hypothetical protein
VRQVQAAELASYLDWFGTLPIWLDLDGLRVSHACGRRRTGSMGGREGRCARLARDGVRGACGGRSGRCPSGRLYAQPQARLNRLDRLNRGRQRVGQTCKSPANAANIERG